MRSTLTILVTLLALVGIARAGPVLGDADGDADLDLKDFAQFANCFSPVAPATPNVCDKFQYAPGPAINKSEFRQFACGFVGPNATVSAVTVAPPVSHTTSTNVVLSGTTAGAAQVKIVGGAQTVITPTSGCGYSASVPLRSNAINHLFVTGVFGDGIESAPAAVTVTHDAQAPSLFVDFPATNAEIAAATTDVAGRVGDALSGFAGLQVRVAVNGQPSILAAIDIGVGANGTFFLAQAPLNVGSNTVTVSATDGVGNLTEKQVLVTRVVVPAGTPQMRVLSGNGQSAPIHTALSQPITVQILSMKGIPLQGKVVKFEIVRSDGRLGADLSDLVPGTAILQAFTDAQGSASAFWRLGSDAGRGNNRIEVTSDGIVGTTVFCASATAAPARQINIGSGNNQRAEAGASAPEPLNAWVNDSCNPVSGIPVTFTVRQGGGKVNGLDAVTINTAPSGHAEVNLTLGSAKGNNVVEANFTGNPNAPAVFTIVGTVRDPVMPTSFSGQVLDNGGQPIQGATCALIIGGTTLPFVQTDLDGQFEIDNIPGSGPADLHVAGASATHVGGANGVDIPPNSFPSLRYSVVVIPNSANTLPTPVLFPRLDPANTRAYSTTQDTELTIAGMAGLKMIVKRGSMKIRSGQQFVPAPNGTAISLNQVHFDDVPMPLPDGAAPPFAWTLQPGGAQFDPPITIIYPNMSGLPAGAIANFLSFNHDTGKFEIIASGHVSSDGTSIISDPGVGISVAGWGCNCPPYSVTGQCCHCHAPCQTCVAGACVPTGNGAPCGSTCCAAGQSCCDGTCCSAGQDCCNGHCVAPDQTCCEDGHTCAAEETCCQGGCCDQGEECCENGCCLADQQCCAGNCISALNICCDNGVECFPEFPMCCGTSCCVSDGVCCDDECQIPGSECCFPGKVCSPPTPRCCGETCCAAGVECCDGVCAAPGAHCCDDANFCSGDTPQCCKETCCAANAVCCNGACCDAGGVCCRGKCEAAGTVCCQEGNTCTEETPVCCHGDCCEPGTVCCEDGCHPEGADCCNETACSDPTPQCCGTGCCGANESCCGKLPCCPAETSCCDGSACCSADEQCCEGACFPTAGGACCPGTNCPSQVCCQGTCCAEGQECCNDGCSPLGSCCSDGREFCGDVCCSPATACCEGECLPPTHCCPDGRQFCGNVCCNAGTVCCSGTCTPEIQCCSDGRPFCGNLCCNAGAVCCSGTCTPEILCCSDGRPFCGNVCCSPGGLCCNGQCRPPGQPCR